MIAASGAMTFVPNDLQSTPKMENKRNILVKTKPRLIPTLRVVIAWNGLLGFKG
ncbi:MAG: hypothetical protein VX130_06025 [Verrucomicrobiota bacterium]|nr:hypothetical protein [Verrucomicrobiota bacterium]